MEERVDIVITDSIPESIEAKIERISLAAERGDLALIQLRRSLQALGSINQSLNPLLQQMRQMENILNNVQTRQSQSVSQTNSLTSSQARLSREVELLNQAMIRTSRLRQQVEAATRRQQQVDAAATNQALINQQRLELATIRTQEAARRAAAAAASAGNRVSSPTSGNSAQAEAERLRRAIDPAYAAQARYNDAVAQANRLHSAGALSANTYAQALLHAETELRRATQANSQFSNTLQNSNRQAGLQVHHLANIGYQLNDIAVSLAGGQNPLLVLFQQGSQLQGISTSAGVSISQMAVAIFNIIKPYLALAAAGTAAVGAVVLFNNEMEKKFKLEEYAKGLGATSKEIKKMELDQIKLTDNVKAFFAVIEKNSGISYVFKGIGKTILDAFTGLFLTIGGGFISFGALAVTTAQQISTAYLKLPAEIRGVAETILNILTYAFVTGPANIGIQAGNGLKTLIKKFKPDLKDSAYLKETKLFDFNLFDTSTSKATGENTADAFVEGYTKNLKSGLDGAKSLFTEYQKTLEEIVKERIKKELAEEGVLKRKKDYIADLKEENRLLSFGEKQRQVEVDLERLIAQAKESNNQLTLEQIGQARQLLTIQQDLNAVNAEESNILSQTIGKREQLIDQLKALKKVQQTRPEFSEGDKATFTVGLLEERGVDTTGATRLDVVNKAQLSARKQFNDEMAKLRQEDLINDQDYYKLLESNSSYKNFQEQILQETQFTGLRQQNREVEIRLNEMVMESWRNKKPLQQEEIESLRQLLILQGELNAINQEADAIWNATVGKREQFINQVTALKNLKQQGGQFTESDSRAGAGAILRNIGVDTSNLRVGLNEELDLYKDQAEKLKELRKQNLIDESTYQNARLQTFLKTNDKYFNSASTFFGNIASLQNTQSKKGFKIGQQAAIAGAVVDTAKAAIGAYSSLASIPYVGPALGVAAASAAVLAGAVQIQNIKRQQPPAGFMAGGYTGNMPTNAVAGVVHGQEYVMNAEATRRIGVANLEAMSKGEIKSAANDEKPQWNIYVENYGKSQDVDVQINENDIRIIVRDEVQKSTPAIVASQIQDSNSLVNKSLNSRYNLGRNR